MPPEHSQGGAPRMEDRRHIPDRRMRNRAVDEVVVEITHKYAEVIDGVDLRNAGVGDELQLPPRAARILVAEGWAEEKRRASTRDRRALAAEESTER